MKTIAKYLTAVMLLMSSGYAGATPSYTLYARDFHFFTDYLTFGMYVTNAHPDSIPEIKYWGGQYFLTFNLLFANGGTLTYSIIGSDLPPELQPINPTVFQNQLRLAPNLPSSSNSVIIATYPGTLIVRMRLRNTVPWATNQSFGLRWKNGTPPATRLSLTYGNNINIPTDSNFHFVDLPTTITNVSDEIPAMFRLYQNYPNPFNPVTKIKFDIPSDERGRTSDVRLTIYNSLGMEAKTLVNEKLSPGDYSIDFDGNDLPGGVYFYKIEIGSFTETKRAILLK